MKIGVVECGAFATRHIVPAIEAIDGCSLHGIQSRSRQMDVPIVTPHPEELICHPEIEAIIICFPTISTSRTLCFAQREILLQ